VFVRVDEANAFLWRALITGPEDTPYSGGCFVFDIYFPGTYPQVGGSAGLGLRVQV
jgi:baculoviral IAP repeat-containing protein 6 (apollon)